MPDFKMSPSHSDVPFGSNQRRYYLTPELSQRINLIRHLIQNSEQLLLVLAETGCGKTSLLNQLKSIAEKKYEHWWIYTLISSPALSPDTLMSGILAAFNVRNDGKPTQVLQESLRSHIAATRYNGQLPVLFVDDAHKLPLATLKFVIELAMWGESLTRMRVILFCEPQITSILAAPEFEIVQKNMTHTLDIPPFSATQVRDYLQFRLAGGRYNTIHPFGSDVIKKIYTESEGIPGEINLYAQQVLRQFAEQRPTQTLPNSLSYSKLLWGIPIVLVLLGIALWIYWESGKPLEDALQSQSLEASLLEPPPPSLYNQVPPTSDETAAPSATSSNLSNHAGATNPIVSRQVAQNNTPPASSRKASTPADKLGKIDLKGEDWLRRQNPNAYTLQILGVHDRLTLKQFIAEHKLNEVAMYKTTFHGKDWYVLVYGIYPNSTQARAALQTLPASLQQSTQPWVRSFASVQKSLNQ